MKSRSIVIALILALLCAGVANAALTISSPTLGGADQERGQNVQTTFTVQDAGYVGARDVSVTLTSNSGYSLMFDDNSTVKSVHLVNSTAVSVTIKGYVPLNHDAVNSNLDPVALQVGTISAESATANVNMQAANHLELNKIKFNVAGKTTTVSDGDEVKDAKVGDDLSIDVTVENTYAGESSDHTNINIKDAKIRVKSQDKDFDLNEDDTTSVDYDSKETVTFSGLEVALDTPDSTYDVDVTADGRDKNGARMGQKATISFVVKRNSHEIMIESASLSRSTVNCDTPTTDVYVTVDNIGTHDESSMAIGVESSALGISQRTSAFSLDQDDTTSRTITLSPKLDKPGTYTVDVVTYWSSSIESNRKTLSLVVGSCTPVTPTTPTSTVVVTPTPVTTPTTTPTTPVVTPQPTTPVNVPVAKVSSTKTDWSVPLLIVGIVIVLVLLGLLVAVLVRGKSQA
jgi:hypothetical protein